MLQKRADTEKVSIRQKARFIPRNNRKHTFSSLKQALVEDNVPTAMQSNVCHCTMKVYGCKVHFYGYKCVSHTTTVMQRGTGMHKTTSTTGQILDICCGEGIIERASVKQHRLINVGTAWLYENGKVISMLLKDTSRFVYMCAMKSMISMRLRIKH